MPQIQVNEIDQSVVTRVVSDDKVKILVPVITSFGPSFDGEQTSVNTFTDITDFNRMYGYTEVEFNPFEDDYSRNYAAQLIQKGAAVSVVRVNGGDPATLNIDGSSTDRTNPSASTIPSYVQKEDYIDSVVKEGATISSGIGDTDIIPGTVVFSYEITEGQTTITKVLKDIPTEGQTPVTTGKLNDGTDDIATITYADGTLVAESGKTIPTQEGTLEYSKYDYTKGTFCPQIKSIKAKYPGSFGNNLLISISQINTQNLSQSYQYANITVYNTISRWIYDGDTAKLVVTGISALETKRVSTNPDDPYYFEDVDFDFIKIEGTDNARTELRLVWSNINGAADSGVVKYSGFPVVRPRYKTANGMVYNSEALMKNGTDFIGYSSEMVTKLRQGFKGYYTADDKWTLTDVQQYILETYGENGVIPTIYDSISLIYNNFTDPYIYDFDFITSGGFVYTKYDSVNKSDYAPTYTSVTDEAVNTLSTDKKTFTLSKGDIKSGSLTFSYAISETTTSYKTESTDDGYVDNVLLSTGTEAVGTLNRSTGEVTFNEALPNVPDANSFKASYQYMTSAQKVPAPVIPTTSATGAYDAVYTTITPIHAAMRDLVNTRQDCIALFDVPYDYDPMAIVEYSRILNTSYGTMHHPWCWVQHPTVANKLIRMAPSYIFLYTFLSNLIDNVNSQKWFPPAGVKRATARVVKKPDYEIGSVILNAWQNDDTSRVNPIMKLKQYGYVIYGQYTTLQAIDLYTHSALESLNVRLICNVVKKKIFDVCLNMAFEPNTSTLWLKFFSQMDEFLRYMKYNEGVYDYKIKMDESTVTTDDINHLRCPGKVWIAPTRTAEFFDIDFIITEAGALFPED